MPQRRVKGLSSPLTKLARPFTFRGGEFNGSEYCNLADHGAFATIGGGFSFMATVRFDSLVPRTLFCFKPNNSESFSIHVRNCNAVGTCEFSITNGGLAGHWEKLEGLESLMAGRDSKTFKLSCLLISAIQSERVESTDFGDPLGLYDLQQERSAKTDAICAGRAALITSICTLASGVVKKSLCVDYFWPYGEKCTVLFSVSSTGDMRIYKKFQSEGVLIARTRGQAPIEAVRSQLLLGWSGDRKEDKFSGTIKDVRVWDDCMTWVQAWASIFEAGKEDEPVQDADDIYEKLIKQSEKRIDEALQAKYRQWTTDMFEDQICSRLTLRDARFEGLRLDDFQFHLLSLERLSRAAFRLWLDLFEERWVLEASGRAKRLQERVFRPVDMGVPAADLVVAGAGGYRGSQVNGQYSLSGHYEGRPMYKMIGEDQDATIYFDKLWKISDGGGGHGILYRSGTTASSRTVPPSTLHVTVSTRGDSDWIYSHSDIFSQQPPLGRWAKKDAEDDNAIDPAPTVTEAASSAEIGTWSYFDGSKFHSYEIAFKFGDYILTQSAHRAEVVLVRGSEWLQGDVKLGSIRMKLTEEGQMLSQYKPENEAIWHEPVVATRESSDMVGTWSYSNDSASGSYEIAIRGGEYIFLQDSHEAKLVHGPEWLEGRTNSGCIRMRLTNEGEMLSQYKDYGEDIWREAAIASRKRAKGRGEMSSHAKALEIGDRVKSLVRKLPFELGKIIAISDGDNTWYEVESSEGRGFMLASELELVSKAPRDVLREKEYGVIVIRGPDWKWGDQDVGLGTQGRTVVDTADDGWICVQWTNGATHQYRVGAEGCYDLKKISDQAARNIQLEDRTEEVQREETYEQIEASTLTSYADVVPPLRPLVLLDATSKPGGKLDILWHIPQSIEFGIVATQIKVRLRNVASPEMTAIFTLDHCTGELVDSAGEAIPAPISNTSLRQLSVGLEYSVILNFWNGVAWSEDSPESSPVLLSASRACASTCDNRHHQLLNLQQGVRNKVPRALPPLPPPAEPPITNSQSSVMSSSPRMQLESQPSETSALSCWSRLVCCSLASARKGAQSTYLRELGDIWTSREQRKIEEITCKIHSQKMRLVALQRSRRVAELELDQLRKRGEALRKSAVASVQNDSSQSSQHSGATSSEAQLLKSQGSSLDVVGLRGFSRPWLNVKYVRRAGQKFEVADQPTFWSKEGYYFLYYYEAARMWCVSELDRFEQIRSGGNYCFAHAAVGVNLEDRACRADWSEWSKDDHDWKLRPKAGVATIEKQHEDNSDQWHSFALSPPLVGSEAMVAKPHCLKRWNVASESDSLKPKTMTL